ncbi:MULTISPECIES: hypothetical protein [unclassified Arcicella]|uniref:hypothetical protein n=1 Tax=unclassified Arcicella TaxID=2644986 RepID=UPI002864D58F|nr:MULTISPECIES: hypothetical protein [unclassified Arcicella]MDR6562024.1 hypothetical protein [Arcicella sp. BE51]MDR6811896.1 hypothetical protein [Arcicella sp. BE140]MDR6822926.1 hypothetical protein [Arcicella sp. BE139]
MQKPNYEGLGLSDYMGPQLRAIVEAQLLADLAHYGISTTSLKFDWSQSCIEGHNTHYLDGSLENFSGIAIYNIDNELVAEGWMEFVHEASFFLAYWDFITVWQDNQIFFEKSKFGIPEHVWIQIPEIIKWNYKSSRL